MTNMEPRFFTEPPTENVIVARYIRHTADGLAYDPTEATIATAVITQAIAVGGSFILALINGMKMFLPVIVAILVIPAIAVVATGMFAAILAGRDVENGAFDLVRLSEVSEHDLVQGYIWLAMFRLRRWLALAAGVGLGWTFLPALPFLAFFWLVIPAVAGMFVYGKTLKMGVMVMFGVLRFAAGLGVWAAVRWRQTSIATPLASVLALAYHLVWSITLMAAAAMPLMIVILAIALIFLLALIAGVPHEIAAHAITAGVSLGALYIPDGMAKLLDWLHRRAMTIMLADMYRCMCQR